MTLKIMLKCYVYELSCAWMCAWTVYIKYNILYII